MPLGQLSDVRLHSNHADPGSHSHSEFELVQPLFWHYTVTSRFLSFALPVSQSIVRWTSSMRLYMQFTIHVLNKCNIWMCISNIFMVFFNISKYKTFIDFNYVVILFPFLFFPVSQNFAYIIAILHRISTSTLGGNWGSDNGGISISDGQTDGFKLQSV